VRVSLEGAMAYRLTPEEKARLDAMTDDDIDYSDIPGQGDRTDWTRPGSILGKGKEIVTLPFDSDVLEFFRKKSRHYSTPMNAVLREYMLAQTRKNPTIKGSAAGAAIRKRAS
jgi:uncharacterized protein (DUF4415 family)